MNNLINLLKNQTIDSHTWIDRLIKEFPESKWFETPEVIETNFAWQIGHLTLSNYYYNVVLIGSPQEEIAKVLDIKKYSEFFVNGEKRNEIQNEFTRDKLLNKWSFIKEKGIEFITKLNDEDLELDIFKLPKEHPFAKTKENAISWNIKHTMWHAGQIATLKRILDKPFDLTT
jgi:hypothetical protein